MYEIIPHDSHKNQSGGHGGHRAGGQAEPLIQTGHVQVTVYSKSQDETHQVEVQEDQNGYDESAANSAAFVTSVGYYDGPPLKQPENTVSDTMDNAHSTKSEGNLFTWTEYYPVENCNQNSCASETLSVNVQHYVPGQENKYN